MSRVNVATLRATSAEVRHAIQQGEWAQGGGPSRPAFETMLETRWRGVSWTIRAPRLNVVQNMNMAHLKLVPDDRRERTRERKRQQVLDAAQVLMEEEGIEGVTMAALAEKLDWAVGTIYIYVPSKAALLLALQERALDTLNRSFNAAQDSWAPILAEEELPSDIEGLVQACAFASFWASASVVLADEFTLQRLLLATRVTFLSHDDVAEVMPLLHRLFEQPRALLDHLVDEGVLTPGPADERVLRWLVSLNGVLQLDNLASLDRHLFRANHHAKRLTEDLLVGWGAPRPVVEVAGSQVDRLAAHGPMAPPPEAWS